ncbi:MAG: hypothetical protein COA47_07320 [Robiginitomaculum sp.]|nr:MAG: hypothetical protein COA47_07320 [Robiginitomaculum sp.]
MAGLNLLDMLAQAQGGSAIGNLGKQFGLDNAAASMAVKALLPAISSGMKRNIAQPDGLSSLLGALQKGNHQQYIDDASQFSQPEARNEGNAILGHLLGSKQVSREVASRAAAQTGISDSVLKQMLPMVAAMAMGSLGKQTAQPGMMDIITGAMGAAGGGRASGGGLLGSLAGSLFGGARKKTASNPLAAMLDADGDGSLMDDVFDMLSKR